MGHVSQITTYLSVMERKLKTMNGKQLKNSILQWAIRGKLVPQDPNDEPASVLLDKIRQEKERLIKEKKSSVTRMHPLSTVVRTILIMPKIRNL